VEFFVGSQLVGTSTTAPYAASYTPPAPGTIYVGVKATDATGQSTSATQPAVVNVSGTATNLPPLVSLSATPSPATAGQPVTLNATASDPDGTVQTVQLYNSGILLATLSAAPYVYSFIPSTAATLVLSAKATDNGGTSTVASVQLVVSPAPVATVTPDPPTQTSNDDTNTQDFDSPYGKSALLVKIGTGGFGAYAGPYAVGNVNRPEGYFQAKVRADTGRAESTITNSPAYTAIVAPGAPTGLAATAGDGQVTLSWTPPSSNGGAAITSYNVYLAGGTTALKASSGTQAVVTAANGTAVSYQVSAVNSAGEGAKSVASDPVTPMAAVVAPPTFAKVLNPGDNTATLTWGGNAGVQLNYNDPVQATASAPGSGAMIVCFPDLNTQIGQLDFDPADAGKPCGVTISGTLYYKNSASGTEQTLAFTDGKVLLS
jgi:hypothetical protein